MLIKIIRGTFGLSANGRVIPVTASSGPIEVNDEIALRLIKKDVAIAVAVRDDEATEVVASAPKTEAHTAVPKYSAKTTRAKLEEIARSIGISDAEIATAETKNDLIDMLDGYAGVI